MHWPKLSTEKIKQRVFEALGNNLNYRTEKILGLPATVLDHEVFYEDAPFLKNAPFLSTLIANPNHIGCHTLEGEKEAVFKGTQQIEKELIRICAEEIFSASPSQYDGYVASGGTEANIQAVWVYRNFFKTGKKAKNEEILLVFSEDSHYSFHKAANLLSLESLVAKVDEKTRQIRINELKEELIKRKQNGVKHFIVSLNMGSTMFGSVDNVDAIADLLKELEISFKLHLDGAFGGFIYPFVAEHNKYSFANPHVSSITIDGHKMLQAPYGTGIFLARKDLVPYVCTQEASYVQGKDYTLCGSRSGANAVSVWMILYTHGSEGWKVKMQHLLDRCTSFCAALDEMGIEYFRDPHMNIVTLKAKNVSARLAEQFLLVPDNHQNPSWYKIVMMPHVKQGILDEFLLALGSDLRNKKPGN